MTERERARAREREREDIGAYRLPERERERVTERERARARAREREDIGAYRLPFISQNVKTNLSLLHAQQRSSKMSLKTNPISKSYISDLSSGEKKVSPRRCLDGKPTHARKSQFRSRIVPSSCEKRGGGGGGGEAVSVWSLQETD